MLVLTETPGGFALFTVSDKKLKQADTEVRLAPGSAAPPLQAPRRPPRLNGACRPPARRMSGTTSRRSRRRRRCAADPGSRDWARLGAVQRRAATAPRPPLTRLLSTLQIAKLKAFSKFENMADGLAAAASLVDSKVPKALKKFLKTHAAGETLAVVDAKLGAAIKEKLAIPCVFSQGVLELSRGLRRQLDGLLGGLAGGDLRPMALGLAHSLSRYKLKFSPDKVDTMIVQAIGLLDDLDKELNTYAMRVREWYGWHFPELAKLVADNVQYAKTALLLRTRERAAGLDFSDFLAEEVEAAVKEAAVVSMGTEIAEEDVLSIGALADQVVALAEYRAQLADYLRARMAAVAPNLTALVGELVGARLIAHVGSLINLAKAPASTVQILGAEKALFRALKAKHETPKYGLIYHASLIGQAPTRHKGKIARVLAAKCALGARVDALGDADDGGALGLAARAKVRRGLGCFERLVFGGLLLVIFWRAAQQVHDAPR
jgi:nucleolar protein 58